MRGAQYGWIHYQEPLQSAICSCWDQLWLYKFTWLQIITCQFCLKLMWHNVKVSYLPCPPSARWWRLVCFPLKSPWNKITSNMGITNLSLGGGGGLDNARNSRVQIHFHIIIITFVVIVIVIFISRPPKPSLPSPPSWSAPAGQLQGGEAVHIDVRSSHYFCHRLWTN